MTDFSSLNVDNIVKSLKPAVQAGQPAAETSQSGLETNLAAIRSRLQSKSREARALGAAKFGGREIASQAPESCFRPVSTPAVDTPAQQRGHSK